MGTKVEAKTCIPGYFDMADSSVNSNGNVLLYHKENKPSVHLSDQFTIISSSGSVHYDKELLKHTMLVHEATFRKQVYELHRLYKIQKDLMAQFQSEDFNGCPRYADALQPWSSVSQTLIADVKGVWQTGMSTSGHDLKHSSIDFMNESSSQNKVNGAAFKHNNVRSGKKLLDLQLPADVYADDDDDVEILDEKPSRNLLVFGGNVKLNLENSEGSSHVEKSWITDIQAHHSSAARVPNKPVEESSNTKITDFLGVGISASQKQHYVSQGVNLNLVSLEGNLKEKCADEISHSRSFNANDDIRENNSFGQRKDDSNSSMPWLKYEQNFANSLVGHNLPNASTFNHFLLAPSGFNFPVNSPWQNNNTTFLNKGQYGTVETSTTKHSLSNGISMDSTPKIPYHHPLKIDGEPQCRKLPPLHDYLKGIDLNDAPVDTTTIWEQGSENSVIDTSRLRKKPLNLIKSQVQSSCADDHSQALVSPTRDPGFPISASAEKDSRCSHTLEYDLNIGPSSEHETDMEMQPQSKETDTNIRNFIDLNEALPIMDASEIDVQKSEDDNVHKHNDPSSESVAITAAESLVAMCNAVVQPGSSELDALHWFAELAISKNTMSNDDSDEDFEALTLKLQETDSYEYHSAPRTQEDNSNDDHFSAASLLVPKSRRGKGRGRRQRKDFQKDILPGLASLSKHEVSEDLYALGKPVTPTRRRGRNGQPPRGRRQARSMAVTIEEAEVSPPPVPPLLAPADLDSDALGITRWGRTTRRCRRPRYPPANKDSLCVA